MLPEFTTIWSVTTEPAGADLSTKPYGQPDADWQYLGRSPCKVRLPREFYRWRVTKEGFTPVEGFPNPVEGRIQFTLDPEGSLPPGMVRVSGNAYRESLYGLADLRALDERVRELDKEIRAIGRENEAVGRVQQLRGIGPLIASALVAMIGDARQFKNGRQVAVALGLTPRQHSSGSKERILGIRSPSWKTLRNVRPSFRSKPLRPARISSNTVNSCESPASRRVARST